MFWQVAIVVLVVLVLAWIFLKPAEQMVSKGPITNGVALFYANWCPACQAIKNDWAATKLGMPEITFEDIDVDNKELSKAREKLYGVPVPGFPTIVIVKNGVGTKYSGKRDKASFMAAFSAAFSK